MNERCCRRSTWCLYILRQYKIKGALGCPSAVRKATRTLVNSMGSDGPVDPLSALQTGIPEMLQLLARSYRHEHLEGSMLQDYGALASGSRECEPVLGILAKCNCIRNRYAHHNNDFTLQVHAGRLCLNTV